MGTRRSGGAPQGSSSPAMRRRTDTRAAPAGSEPTPTRTSTATRNGDGALDNADRIIVDALASDGRISNRALASATGLTEPTVATRLQRLREQKRLHVTAQLDYRMLGYVVETELFVTVRGRAPRAVATDLTTHPRIQAVALTVGTCDVVAEVYTFADEDPNAILSHVARIPGVSSIEPISVIKWHKRVAARGALTQTPKELPELTRADLELDDIDRLLISELIKDGRQSNRSIGRAIGVAESTIRVRLRRLEDSGLLRIVGVADRTAMGMNGDVVFAAIEVDGDPSIVADKICSWPETMGCYTTISRTPLRALFVTTGPNRLGELICDRLHSIPEVQRVDTLLSTERVMHNYVLTHFVV